jgi:alkylhydroperoxidase family enzyme
MARLELPEGDGPEIARVWALRPELGGPVAALSKAVYEQSCLHPREREAVRMRIAQINDCPI